MNLPYTADPVAAVMVAQTAVGATLTAVMWSRPLSKKLATVLFLAAIWLAVLLPVTPALMKLLTDAPPHPDHAMWVLRVSAALATVAMMLNGRISLVVAGVAAEIGLGRLGSYVSSSDLELAGMHLLWFGALIALVRRIEDDASAPSPEPVRSYAREDLVMFGAAVVLAALVAVYVLERSIDSDDEWGYTYQADLFAHGKAYAPAPPCGDAFRMFWVWFYQGRSFAQYTPGWPLFMAPFAAVGMTWFAAPVTHGLLVVGVARLARRITAANGSPSGQIAWSGRIAALAACTGAATLMNAGSRFPHVFVGACFAWSIEAVCAMTSPTITPRSKWTWGVVLGLAVSFLVSSRPADAAALEVGVLSIFAYALLRGRVGWRAFTGAALTFGIVSVVSLIILRLQMGVWFKTGYDVVSQFHPWVVLKYSVPSPSEFRFGIPLATSSYSFWPCAPAFAAAGLLNVRNEGRAIAFMLVAGSLCLAGFLTMLEFGRGMDFGYGPRYHLPHVVTMAVGAGVLLAPLFAKVEALLSTPRAFFAAGPAALVVAAMIVGVVRIAPLMYPYAHDEIRHRNALFRAIKTRLKSTMRS